MENRDDRFYIDRVLEGDTDAFAPLVERYKAMVYNIALKLVRNREDAEEITQDSFIRAYRSLKGFRGESRFSTWLYRIVWNSSVSFLRGRKLRYGEGSVSIDRLKDSEQSAETDNEAGDRMIIALNRATQRLPVDDQLMLALYYYEDNSIEDIAAIMNLSPSNVKVRLFRTRKKLHDMIRSVNSNVKTDINI